MDGQLAVFPDSFDQTGKGRGYLLDGPVDLSIQREVV